MSASNTDLTVLFFLLIYVFKKIVLFFLTIFVFVSLQTIIVHVPLDCSRLSEGRYQFKRDCKYQHNSRGDWEGERAPSFRP